MEYSRGVQPLSRTNNGNILLIGVQLPTSSSCCTEQTEESRGKRSSIPKISCRGFGFWVSQCEQQTGEKSHTHPMSIPGCSAQRVRDHSEIKTEIIYGVFFSVFCPLLSVWVHSSRARCNTTVTGHGRTTQLGWN